MISNELLKKKILDEAIHGRLIENDPSLKPLDVPSIDKDIPFEIPNNWKWSRLTNIFEVKGGKRIPKGDTFSEVGNHVYIRVADMENMTINTKNLKYIDEEVFDKIKNYIITDKDLYITVAGTIGQVGSVPKELNGMNLTENANRLIPKNVNKEYYKYILNGKFMQNSIKESTTKAAQPKLAIKRINDLIVPVPPLEEQEKIVKKIEGLFKLIDKKEKNDKEKEKLKTLLKEKILDSAIHGELVENDLLLLPVDVEEIKEAGPFEIPNNWMWSNFEYITTKISDGAHSTPKYVDNGIPFLSVKDISDGNISFENCKYISEEQHKVLYSRCDPKYGDLLITKVGTTGVPVVVDTNIEFSLFVSVAMLRFDENKIYNKYIKYATLSKLIQSQIDENTRGAANKNWVIKDIKKTIIPIPPLEQQKKIVEKIEKYFELIEQL